MINVVENIPKIVMKTNNKNNKNNNNLLVSDNDKLKK